ncbi:MAG TPA: LacI family DNA-binding transcriptional regulator [Abditibacterium sp.]|jgi:LacI family transcriptional regulator
MKNSPPIPPKAPTIHDVAAALGMHKSTVSLAFSGKGNLSAATRQRVLSVARELGYQPNPLAQRLANGVNNSMVCLCSGGLDLGLMTEKILLIQKELSRAGLEAPIYTFSHSEENGISSQAAEIKLLCRQQPRAIVCAGQMLSSSVFPYLQAYQRDGGIVVCYDIAVPIECDQVIFDREDNAYRAAKYLIERGHQHIGIGLSNTSLWEHVEVTMPQSHRLRGFRRALTEFGLPVRDEWLFENPTYEKGGAEMARHFLESKERPTGLCIVNDYVALAFMVEIMRAGVAVPEDVSIVGHDDQPVASYCPVPLTSVSQPVTQIAHAVVELLLERVRGSQEPPRTVVVQGELVERQSVSVRG